MYMLCVKVTRGKIDVRQRRYIYISETSRDKNFNAGDKIYTTWD